MYSQSYGRHQSYCGSNFDHELNIRKAFWNQNSKNGYYKEEEENEANQFNYQIPLEYRQKICYTQIPKKTPVLLVCIFNKNAIIITHDILYRLFAIHGQVKKILIFEKAKMWKAFIEMDSKISAQNSINNLNNYPIFDDGSKMNVYYSNMQSLEFQNNNSGGVDYTKLINQKNSMSSSNNQSQRNSFYNYNSTTCASSKTSNTGFFPSSDSPLTPGSSKNIFQDYKDYSYIFSQNDNIVNKSFSDDQQYIQTRVQINLSIQQGTQESLPSKSDIDDLRKEEHKLNNQTIMSKEQQKMQIQEQLENIISKDLNNISETNISNIDQIIYQNRIKNKNNSVIYSSASKDLPNPPQQSQQQQQPHPTQFLLLQQKQTLTDSLPGSQVVDPQQQPQQPNSQLQLAQFQAPNQSVVGLNKPTSSFETANLPSADQQQQQTLLQQQYDIDPSSYVNPKFLQENKKSKVIYVRGLENMNIEIPNIYNLFSNFGNIYVMIFFRSKKYCLIEFETIEYATHAKDFLNNIKFMDNPIRIFYSNYDMINLKHGDEQSNDVFIGSENTFRFKKNRTYSINPPSQHLHVSNLKLEACNEESITKLFSEFGVVEAVQIMMQKNKNMALVRMSSLQEAITGIIHLHGQDILGRKIQISFTRSKIQ